MYVRVCACAVGNEVLFFHVVKGTCMMAETTECLRQRDRSATVAVLFCGRRAPIFEDLFDIPRLRAETCLFGVGGLQQDHL